MNITKPTKIKEIDRSWHLIDAKGKILGRMATQIAVLLMGKNKPNFTRNLDCGDFVVVINCQDVQVSGNKAATKIYARHSGYPGGIKKERFDKMSIRNPKKVVELAVKNMLPNNKLRDRMMVRLKLFSGETHDFKDKILI